jgi:hypothetical protein
LIECHRRPVILEEARPDKEVYRTVTISRGIDERIILTEAIILVFGKFSKDTLIRSDILLTH